MRQPSPGAGEGRRRMWFDRVMRWGQLTLVEDDPVKYDVDFWLDYFERTKCDAVCLSAGGYVAYYPTDVPLHHRSRWMNGGDPFGELVAGCRARGMAVLARTDPHAVHQPVLDAHPDWIAVDANGDKRRHWSTPDAWVTCALGPYNFTYMPDVNAEIMARYDVVGIFSNRWTGSGMCYCEHCQRNFRDSAGMDLPRTDDPQDPARKAYIVWRQQRLFALCRQWDTAIRAANPDARFIPNSGGGALSDLDMSEFARVADTAFADKQGRSGIVTPWAAGKNAKEYRATMRDKPIGGIFSVGLEGTHRWKDSTQSGDEIRIWVAESVANGMRPWFTKFAGVVHDGRWLKVVEDLYRWHHRWERYFCDQVPLARVAVAYSQQTAKFYGGGAARLKVEDHISGVYQALLEGRIPFEMVHDGMLTPDVLDSFSTIVLPNIAALSDAQCDQIREFVARGGSVVATHETSLYDEWGVRRTRFGLEDLFGVAPARDTETGIRNAYIRLREDPRTGRRHALLEGLDDASRIIYGVGRVPVEVLDESSPRPLTFVPSHPDLPMEEVYPREIESESDAGERSVLLREVGAGRVVYFPWDIDRTFWEVLDPDHGRLLRNAVAWATREEHPVTVTGQGIVDVTVWRQPTSLTVHLVNLTNPMLMRGAFRELVPLGEQRVRVVLPAGARVGRAHLLRADTSAQVQVSDGVAEVAVAGITDHEVVALDLA
ncbi:alpha-amylase family protein [Actinopolymorpha sp. B9G3]|uniref:alpha-amylase family protein n=1 Tax=Actinopolymorpha sp. B9G3 TaxID=3158970 RepID=UPI0032D90CA7